jgi:hypothetical protein
MYNQIYHYFVDIFHIGHIQISFRQPVLALHLRNGLVVHKVNVESYTLFLLAVFFFMGGLNLLVGTWAYLVTLRRIRRRHGRAWLGLVFHGTMALVHLTLWFSAVIMYLGYLPEDEVEECGCFEGEEGGFKGQGTVRRIIVDVKPVEDNNGGKGKA